MPPQFDNAADFHQCEFSVSKKSAFQVVQIIIHFAPYFQEGPMMLLMDGGHLAEGCCSGKHLCSSVVRHCACMVSE